VTGIKILAAVKTPSKLSPYEFKLRFKPSIFMHKHSYKVVSKTNAPALENLLNFNFKIILALRCQHTPKYPACMKFSQIMRIFAATIFEQCTFF
jgi:hypothetical protein